MAIWEKNILGLVSQDEWLRVGLNVTRPNDPIDGLFGDEKTNNLFAKWQSLASEYQIPTMAQFHGFDTEAQKTIRVPVGCCPTITVANASVSATPATTPAPTITVRNLNVTVQRTA